MRSIAFALLFATTTSQPQPAPLPDATPTLRGAINTEPSQRLRGKTFVDRVTVDVDAGPAYASTCVALGALGACPSTGNLLQCVRDAGWYACQPDGGWAQLGSGMSSGGGSSGVSSVSASAPLSSSGGSTPTISCAVASGGTAGCLSSADYASFNGRLTSVTTSGSALSATGGTAPIMSCINASASQGAGCLTSTDWSTFNAKENALTFSTPIKRSTNAIIIDPAATLSIASIYSAVVDAGVITSPLLYTPNITTNVANSSVTITGTSVGTNSTPDVILNSSGTKTLGDIVSIQQNGVEVSHFDYIGRLHTPLLAAQEWQSEPFGGGSTIMTTKPAIDVSPGMSIDTIFNTIGPPLQVNVAGTPLLIVNGESAPGTIDAPFNGPGPSFRDSSHSSGHQSLGVSEGLYMFTAGSLPPGYYGHHGAMAVGNTHAMIAGFLFEVGNPEKGTTTDKKLMVNHQGGLVQFGGYSEAQFAICRDSDPTNAVTDGGCIVQSDGGTCDGFVATDAGYAFSGTQMWAADKRIWCYCDAQACDGGSQGTTGDGWLRMHDRLPCAR